MRVSIVTATTGNPLLKQAIESVQAQDYDNLEHIIVIDGKEREEAANQVLSSVTFTKPYHILTLPYPTGLDGYVCHRIYGASAYLVNGDYIVFLDDDNWFEPYHISSLVDLVYSKNLDWAYALRNIVNSDGEFITQDNCESLGKDRVFTDYHHVDTNCYFIRKDIAVKLSPTWHKRYRESGLNADMILCDNLLRYFPNCDTNGLYSVNYRTDATEKSVKSSFFLYGNSLVKSQLPDGYPWRKELPNYQEELKDNLQLREINLITFPDWKINDSELLKEDLNSIIKTILNHPEKTKINLLIFVPESLREEVEVFLWDLMLSFMEDNQLESDLPEITLVSEMSPVRWSYLITFLSGYVKINHQDTNVLSQTVQDKLNALSPEEISKNKLSDVQIVTI
ncbi:probable glycosyl transferase [Crocosphaera subtropica ATCC 51142]|uniref:Probable glycosyl transferase n=1 Tax=Crocosphaera subtropica (strain ATCC 51142 / BH68) TaxID=43989 RepID=B1WV05_CROS5|nr:glycosyltransferase family 2 protein [Crocosphaera subtropica]ACB52202.1 probable glycosyl transferase [Crocosphaera subtropica ATCC 51142]